MITVHEYIMRLCDCGMRVDRAYTIVNSFFEQLDFAGLDEFVKDFETAHRIIERYVD